MKVLRTELVTVPAGAFFAYVIECRDRMPQDATENVATSWYAPSVGTIVKFQEEVGRPTKPRLSYEVVSIRLPHPLTGTTVTSAVRRPDTAEMHTQFCREHRSTIRLADGRVMVLDCSTYVQADRLAYENWLLVR